MSKELVSDELWEIIEPLLPQEPPEPYGGRPRVDDRAALSGIVFVLKNGIPWEMLPQEVLGEAVDAITPIRKPGGRPGRLRKRPKKLRADKAYDFPRCRQALRKRGIKARISRRGIDSSEKLGRHRWVVERTLAWLSR